MTPAFSAWGVPFYQLLTGGVLRYPVVEGADPDHTDKTKLELDYGTPPAHPSTHYSNASKALGNVALAAHRPDLADRVATPRDFKEVLPQAVQALGLRNRRLGHFHSSAANGHRAGQSNYGGGRAA